MLKMKFGDFDCVTIYAKNWFIRACYGLNAFEDWAGIMLAFRLSRDVGLGIKVLEKLSDPSSRFSD